MATAHTANRLGTWRCTSAPPGPVSRLYWARAIGPSVGDTRSRCRMRHAFGISKAFAEYDFLLAVLHNAVKQKREPEHL
ncbi:hypothetical protein EVAR_9040_1 [Eumeta japonica]|uniref:Uncharacterized protein n=1 Tax=Eumeta variegata TaxID=151549 RepID=A0A4C1TWA2_EUMVA|nr:hypothetical protein EVAR_9040_1 [Eumeta japonica]